MGSNNSFFKRSVGGWGSKERKWDNGTRLAAKWDTVEQIKEIYAIHKCLEEEFDDSFHIADVYGLHTEDYLDAEGGYKTTLDQLKEENLVLKQDLKFWVGKWKENKDLHNGVEITRLKAEIKGLKQEVNRWKAKYKSVYTSWMGSWRRSKEMEVQTLLDVLQKQFDEHMEI